MEQVPEALARWAIGDGGVHVDAAARLLADGADELALATSLRAHLPADRAAFAAAAAHARRAALAAGVEGAQHLVLTREAVEQASHPAVAAWRAGRAAAPGMALHDWCAGTGADAVALARHGPVDAVEADAGRAVLAAHRAAVLDRPVRVHVGDVLEPPVDPVGGVVHADPDRRDAHGRRARTLGGHRPGVAALRGAAAPAAGRLFTVAPGVSWDDPELPDDAEVAFLQVDDRLVEACLLEGMAAVPGVRARAVLLPAGHELERVGPPLELPVGEPGEWLLRPAVAAVRARLHTALGADVGAWRLDRRRALLTSRERPPHGPWLDAERVVASVPARPRAVREVLRALDEPRVELLLHGLRTDPATFLRAAGRPATGPDDVRVHLVRRERDALAVVTRTT